MKLTRPELSQLVRQHTARKPSSACPDAEQLTRAALGELGGSERGRLADHLLGCRDCTEEYQLALSLQSWAQEAAPELQPSEAADTRLTPATAPPTVAPPRNEPKPGWVDRFRESFSLPAAAYLTATSLLSLALIGWVATLYFKNVRLEEAARESANLNQSIADDAQRRAQQADTLTAELRKTIAELSQPQLNAPIADLFPRESYRGQGRDAVQTIDLPAGTNIFTMILNVTGQAGSADYELEVRSASGQTLYQGRGLRKSAENTFTVALSTRLLPAGQYLFGVYGLNNNQRTLVQNYRVQLRYTK